MVYTRQPHNKLGDKSRDRPLGLDSLVLRRMQPGGERCTLTVTHRDTRQFVVVITLGRSRTAAEVEALGLPLETVEAAVARVKAAVADDDVDMEVQTVVTLLDPMTSLRMRVPMYFEGVTAPLRAFDRDWNLDHMH